MESIYEKINHMTANSVKVISKSDIRRYRASMRERKRLQDILGQLTKIENAVKDTKHKIIAQLRNHSKYENKYIIVLGYDYYDPGLHHPLIVYSPFSDFLSTHIRITSFNMVIHNLNKFAISKQKKDHLLKIADDFLYKHSNIVSSKTLCCSNTFRPQVYKVPDFIRKFKFTE